MKRNSNTVSLQTVGLGTVSLPVLELPLTGWGGGSTPSTTLLVNDSGDYIINGNGDNIIPSM